MTDERISVKLMPDVSDEDLKAFQEKLSGVMAGVTLDMPDRDERDRDGNKHDAGEMTGLSDEAKSDLADTYVRSQQDMATKGADILSKIQAPTVAATEGMSKGMMGVMGGMAAGMAIAAESVSSIFDLVKKAFGGPLATMLDMLSNVMSMILLPINVALTMVLAPAVKWLSERMGRFVQSALKAYDEGGLGGVIMATFSELGSLLTTVLGLLWGWMKENIPAMWASLCEDGTVGPFFRVLTDVGRIAGEFIKFIGGVWTGIVLPFLTAAGDWFGRLLDTVSGIITMVKGVWDEHLYPFLSGVWEGMRAVWTAVRPILEGIWNGIMDAWGLLSGTFKTVFEGIWNAMKALIDIVSQIFGGIGDAAKGIGDAVGGFFDGVKGMLGFAEGGVFEPNNPVMIKVGDNRYEREIVSPYSTIVQAVGDAMTQYNSTSGTSMARTVNVTNHFHITGNNGEEIGNSVMRLLDKSVSKSASKW